MVAAVLTEQGILIKTMSKSIVKKKVEPGLHFLLRLCILICLAELSEISSTYLAMSITLPLIVAMVSKNGLQEFHLTICIKC